MNKKINNYLLNNIKIADNSKFALIIGSSPSKGARSPILWNSAYKKLKKNIKMYPADVGEKKLSKILNCLKSNKNFLGSSVTAPYKEKVMMYLDKIDKQAKIIGSVNTIKNNDGKLVGYNTDYFGSLFTLKKMKLKKNNSSIIVLGCGGAGKACINSVINYFTKSKIYLFNRNNNKLKNFKKRLIKNTNNKIVIIKKISSIKKIQKVDLILNTTSVGFDGWFGENKKFIMVKCSPLGKVNLKKIGNKNISNFDKINQINYNKNFIETANILERFKNVYVFDIIYNPNHTRLMQISNLLGLKTINGLTMNLMQAVEGFRIVNGYGSVDKIQKAMI